MFDFSKFLMRNSQKLAGIGLLTGYLTTFMVQPYIEVFLRWGQTRFKRQKEVNPDERITAALARVYRLLNVPQGVYSSLDIYMTDSSEISSLGSLTTPRKYAFIGVPHFFKYRTVEEIPLTNLNFYTINFPHGPFSDVGRERLKLMILPESALEFVLAREVISLLGSSRLKSLLLDKNLYIGHFPSAESVNIIASLSRITVVYLTYQVIYALNQLLALRSFLSMRVRFLGYVGSVALSFAIQHQLVSAWRARIAFALDQAVVSATAPDQLIEGGRAYYAWRSRVNAYSAQRLTESQTVAETVMKVRLGFKDSLLPFNVMHQLQMGLINPYYLTRPTSDYYLVPVAVEAAGKSGFRIDKLTGLEHKKQIPKYSAYTPMGGERFASDGYSINLGLSGSIVCGTFPKWFAGFASIFLAPATSLQRLSALHSNF